jgi:hypothetical protein
VGGVRFSSDQVGCNVLRGNRSGRLVRGADPSEWPAGGAHRGAPGAFGDRAAGAGLRPAYQKTRPPRPPAVDFPEAPARPPPIPRSVSHGAPGQEFDFFWIATGYGDEMGSLRQSALRGGVRSRPGHLHLLPIGQVPRRGGDGARSGGGRCARRESRWFLRRHGLRRRNGFAPSIEPAGFASFRARRRAGAVASVSGTLGRGAANCQGAASGPFPSPGIRSTLGVVGRSAIGPGEATRLFIRSGNGRPVVTQSGFIEWEHPPGSLTARLRLPLPRGRGRGSEPCPSLVWHRPGCTTDPVGFDPP